MDTTTKTGNIISIDALRNLYPDFDGEEFTVAQYPEFHSTIDSDFGADMVHVYRHVDTDMYRYGHAVIDDGQALLAISARCGETILTRRMKSVQSPLDALLALLAALEAYENHEGLLPGWSEKAYETGWVHHPRLDCSCDDLAADMDVATAVEVILRGRREIPLREFATKFMGVSYDTAHERHRRGSLDVAVTQARSPVGKYRGTALMVSAGEVLRYVTANSISETAPVTLPSPPRGHEWRVVQTARGSAIEAFEV